MKFIPVLLIALFIRCSAQPVNPLSPHQLACFNSSSNVNSPAGRVSLPQDEQRLGYDGDDGRKNVTLAAVYSLLLPGMGELYVGNYTTGKYFTMVEGALWLTMGGYDWYATGLRDDSRRFAIEHAQVNINGKDDQYFVDIGEFQNIYDYNEQILRNRQPQNVYSPTTSYWSWDSDANRLRYSDLRVSSDERFNDMRFVAAAIAVNHVVSAVNAARLAILHNRSADAQSGAIDIHADIIGGLARPSGVMVSITHNF